MISYNDDLLHSVQAARLRVVLVSTRNSLNIGAAARAMSNFGVLDLRVVRPYDPAFREARSAVGAASLLADARLYDTVAEAVAECRLVVGTSAKLDRDAHHVLHSLEAAAPLIEAELAQSEVALLFGSEKFGLSNDDLSHCDWLLHIPTREQHLSMNLGQAVGICLYELMRAPGGPEDALKAEQPPDERATTADRERLAETLMEAIAASGYRGKHQQVDLHAQVRRMMARLHWNAKDAHTMLGMLRQMLWKMRAGPDAGQRRDE